MNKKREWGDLSQSTIDDREYREVYDTEKAVIGEKYFKLRDKLNEEMAAYLSSEGEVARRITKLKKKYKIRKISLKADFQFEKFLENLSEPSRSEVEKELNALVDRYKLPSVFFNWFGEWLFHNQLPSKYPRYNFAIINDVYKNPDRLVRFGLTTGEKQFIRLTLRKNLGIGRGRPSRAQAAAFAKINNILSLSKNPWRPFPFFRAALDAEGYKASRPYEITSFDGLEIEKRHDYKFAAEMIFPFAPPEKDDRRVQRLRKYVQRMKKRRAKMLK